MQIIEISADNNFKYRLDGSNAWISLQGGVTHELSFAEGSRVELTATSSITHMKINGAVLNVNILESELTDLSESFKDTRMMIDAKINTSSHITNMESTFENSGVVSFTIPTFEVNNLKNSFKNTNGLVSADLSLSNAVDTSGIFENSKVQTLNGMLTYKKGSIDKAIKGTSLISSIDGLNLVKSGNDDIGSKNFFNTGKLAETIGIDFIRGKVSIRKEYLPVSYAEFDDSKTFEMDIETIQEPSRYGLDKDISTLEKTIDQSKTFELDVYYDNMLIDSSERLPSTFNILDETNLSGATDFDYDLEMDLELANKLRIDSRTSGEEEVLDIDTTIDHSKTFEMDIVQGTNFLRYSHDMSIDGLDESIDPLMSVEIDINADGYESDVLGDGSCIYHVGRHNRQELIHGENIVHSSPLIPEIRDRIYFNGPKRSYRMTDLTRQDVRDNMMKNSYFRFYMAEDAISTLYVINAESSDEYTRIGWQISYQSPGLARVKIILRGAKSDAYSTEEVPFDVPSKEGDRISIATVESDIAGDYDVYINGVKRHTYTLNITESMENNSKLSLQGRKYAAYRYRMEMFKVFDRKLTQADIDILENSN